MSRPAKPGSAAVQAWYDELHSPGYDFSTHQSPGTGHFSQVVWMNTTHVGAGRSDDGVYVVANYAPPGNYVGDYEPNVRPAAEQPASEKPVIPLSLAPPAVPHYTTPVAVPPAFINPSGGTPPKPQFQMPIPVRQPTARPSPARPALPVRSAAPAPPRAAAQVPTAVRVDC